MLDEKDEIELLRFWLENPDSIGEVSPELKNKVNNEEVEKLINILAPSNQNILVSINERLDKLQNKALKKEEIAIQKKTSSLRYMWKSFLLFGVIIVVINTFISAVVTFKVNEVLQGPACRIDVNLQNNEFSWNKSSQFKLTYGIVNLRNQKVQISRLASLCYWPPIGSNEINITPQNIPTLPPIIPPPSIPPPQPQIIEELQGISYTAMGCRTPDNTGDYKVRIIVNLNTGSCEKELLMHVV